jgi:hypothetical protein
MGNDRWYDRIFRRKLARLFPVSIDVLAWVVRAESIRSFRGGAKKEAN